MATTDQNQPMFTQAHLDEMVATPSGHINIGPVSINWSISLTPPQISGTVALLGKQIASFDLTPQHPSVTLGGSAGPFTVKITLTVDFKTRTLNYDVEIKVPILPPKHYKGSIHF